MVEDCRMYLIWITGDAQLADALTKCLSSAAPTFVIFLVLVETPISP
jgi:hypothetical protein